MLRKKISAFLLSVLLGAGFTARADEGMWLPMLLKQLNEADMQKKGLKLSADDIYSINRSSLIDAIVSFGGFCTGEMISPEGLLLTNHHCGYGQVQSHSSVEKDYLTKGFWAMNRSEELPNPGLTATFIVRMEDVTKQVLNGVTPQMNETEREKKIQENQKQIEAEAVKGTHYGAQIKPFFYGNEYYMYVTETFKDVRLVGAPPSSIGKFGGDTDNWMWPRHTGDFSIFRVYAGPDNKPAEYSKDNKPYRPKHHLPISMNGVKEGDFTMVFGFPGRTNEYLTSFAVQEIYEVSNPAKIKIRETKLGILDQDMKASDEVRIKYAAKYASIANYWKKWIGENRGLKKLDAVNRKRMQEQLFTEWVQQDATRKAVYGNLLADFEKNYNNLNGITISRDYVMEAALGVELVSYALNYTTLMDLYNNKAPQADIEKQLKRMEDGAAKFYKDYNAPTDKKVFAALLNMYYKNIDKNLQPEIFRMVEKKYDGDFAKYAEAVYKKSFMTYEEGTKSAIAKARSGKTKHIAKDPAYQLARSIIDNYRSKILPVYSAANDSNTLLYRTYLAGLRQMQQDKKFYPDANSTLRVAYGQVAPYEPFDGAVYEYYTTLDGIIEKNRLDHPDFEIPEKVADLYAKKDYGQYAVNGTVPVCFIANNHTTGGNSGSPVLNANGQLIGTNFDRSWESTMSDIMFDPERVRNIVLDVRYMLFVVDKVAGAGHLVKEMTLVKGDENNLTTAVKTAEPLNPADFEPKVTPIIDLTPADAEKIRNSLQKRLKKVNSAQESAPVRN